MILTVFHKTGEYYDTQGDWDGDNGYNVEIEVDDKKVRKDVFEMLCSDYFMLFLSYNLITKGGIKHILHSVIEDNDLWNKLIENYSERLKTKYEEEFCNNE